LRERGPGGEGLREAGAVEAGRAQQSAVDIAQ
jgi:hypothetical protein